ncbi:methylenetetrahydrofolate reductase [Clostridium akagii]|uniref:methylenetetrahydrofolate reductase n=1 Tax=Clostridium akagii TaxID=91623 RepID=UPI00047D10A4|nr:methylenetetrahydrofolate reductase [Clostridium akagii]
MLKDKILNKEPGILIYGITPPKKGTEQEKVKEISQKQMERIKDTDIDGLILYDIQDEEDRITEERPFPFLETIDPQIYSEKYLEDLEIPKIIYRCVGKYGETELSNWLQSDLDKDRFSVFVGASAKTQKVRLNLKDAYSLSRKLNSKLNFGGVIIPERHTKYDDEHLRIISKIQNGCKFFVSQAVYDVEPAKNFLSDYYYYCRNNNIEMVPIIINLTPCGSIKTLEFMKWLGINIPKWLENDLMNSNDILQKSLDLSINTFEQLLDFGLEKGIPIGCSIESVSNRKIEIEASIQLTKDIKAIMNRKIK